MLLVFLSRNTSNMILVGSLCQSLTLWRPLVSSSCLSSILTLQVTRRLPITWGAIGHMASCCLWAGAVDVHGNTCVACTCPTALEAGVIAVILKSSSVVGNLLILCMIILMRVQASHECIRDDRTESQYNLSFIVMERCWLDVRWLPVVSRLCSDIHLTAIPIALAVFCCPRRQRTFSSESMLMHTLPRFAWVTRHCTLVIAEQGHECRVLPSSHHLHTAQCLMN